MKNKIVKKITLGILGFDIELTNVPMIEFRGEDIPNINYNKLEKAVLLKLCYKEYPLTGNEVRFIRKYFNLTTTEFGKKFGYTHTAVLKWENQGDEITRMVPTAEFCLRLYVLEHLQEGSKDLEELYKGMKEIEIGIPKWADHLKKTIKYKHVPMTVNVAMFKNFSSIKKCD